jgi:hypothetical protein
VPLRLAVAPRALFSGIWLIYGLVWPLVDKGLPEGGWEPLADVGCGGLKTFAAQWF